MLGLQQIFGRDDAFYNLLESSADEAKVSASLLVKLLPVIEKPESEQVLSELALSRRKHKRITQEITQLLCKNFVTPLEREDIDALSHALYRIPKNIEKIGGYMLISPENISDHHFTRQVAMLEQAATAVAVMVRALRKRPHVETITDEHARLQAVEGDADKLMTDALRDLYRGDATAKEILILKDLYELLEKVIDRCRDAGNVVFQVVLKYS